MKKNILTLALMVLLTSCGEKIVVDGITGTVDEVLSGNEIHLDNGLTVELIGFTPSSSTEKYLTTCVLNNEVEIITDSENSPATLKSYDASIKAYARLIEGSGYCISGTLLRARDRYETDLDDTFIADSLEIFQEYLKNPIPPVMDLKELRAYLIPRTFLIAAQTPTGTSYGTGFFIDENGLALTNHHVLNDQSTWNEKIYYLTEDGNVSETMVRDVKRKVFSAATGDSPVDFSIFYVNLDPGEKSQYIPLIKEHVPYGEEIAKMGCPNAQPAIFKYGASIDSYQEGWFKHGLDTYSGDSGSPIVDYRGRALGINQGSDANLKAVYSTDGTVTGITQERAPVRYGVDAVFIREILKKLNIDYLH